MRDYESVRGFITQRYQESQHADAMAAEKETRQGVTLRLPVGHLAVIDRLSKEFSMTRQDFLSSLIDVALQDTIKALADLAPEKDRMKVWKDYSETMSSGVSHE